MKDLTRSFKEQATSESRYVPMEDTEQQQQYLQDGWMGTGN